ncbi:MAG: hypothetical protein JSS11_11020 [Verrucomicrobia bacterium]|nr:hypothetical protein [Verrucomicrobiota bacterium]
MRLLLAVLLFATALAPARAAGVEFVRVWPAWRDTDSFRRISEYFTGKENTGGEIVLRTHPDSRDGFYFLARLKNPDAALAGAKFVLHLITPEKPETKLFTFPVTVPAGQTVFQLGLTGADWAGPKVHPVAWQLELQSADGKVLASHHSFLWEKPAK